MSEEKEGEWLDDVAAIVSDSEAKFLNDPMRAKVEGKGRYERRGYQKEVDDIPPKVVKKIIRDEVEEVLGVYFDLETREEKRKRLKAWSRKSGIFIDEKEYKPSDRDKEVCVALYKVGVPMQVIEKIVRISKKAIMRFYGREMEEGAAVLHGRVCNALFQNCLRGNVQAQIFWLKARAGWKEIDQLQLTGEDGGAVRLAVDAPRQESREEWLRRKEKELGTDINQEKILKIIEATKEKPVVEVAVEEPKEETQEILEANDGENLEELEEKNQEILEDVN